MSEYPSFPKISTPADKVLDQMDDFHKMDVDWKHGKTFSLVYPTTDEHQEFLKKAHNMFFSENALNPMAFKSLRQFEHQTVRMCADLFHGDQETVGLVTSGGTESLIMAVKAYRSRARKLKPWILKPEIVMPETAHAALDKAGYYFDVKIRHAPVGPDFRVDIKAVKKLINRNTIMMVGSAPQYPQGVIDPIVQLGELAQEKKIPLHVDACIGGMILPFIEKLGYPVPAWDFQVPGVTSISADLHKYGYSAKGASLLLYRNMSYMKHQFFIYTDWKGGGIYASPSFPGTRPGGPIAAAWGTIVKLGEEGYLDLTKKVLEARNYFIEELAKIPELKLLAYPDSSILGFTHADPKVGIYAVADQMQEKGWNIDRQQSPESIHLTFSPAHTEFIKGFVEDLRLSVETVKAHPELNTTGQAAMYGMMAKIPFRGMIKGSVLGIMEKMYGPKAKTNIEKNGEVENWGDFIEKVGTNALGVISKVKSTFSNSKDS